MKKVYIPFSPSMKLVKKDHVYINFSMTLNMLVANNIQNYIPFNFTWFQTNIHKSFFMYETRQS